MDSASPKTSSLAVVSFAAALAWYVIILGSSVYIVRHPHFPQEWWLLPRTFGAAIAWLPFTIVSLVAGAKALAATRQDRSKWRGRGLALTGIVLALLSPVAGIAGMYAALAIRRGWFH